MTGACRAFGLEDLAADGVDVGTGAFKNVGTAVDHRFQQFQHDAFAVDFRRRGALQFMLDGGERARRVVAHRHKTAVRHDEGDRRGAWRIGFGPAHQDRRHVAGAVLDIETAGDFDLLHFLARRHRDPHQLLDRAVFLRRRVHHIDPRRGFGQRF